MYLENTLRFSWHGVLFSYLNYSALWFSGIQSSSLTIYNECLWLTTIKTEMKSDINLDCLELICPPLAPTYYRKNCSSKCFQGTCYCSWMLLHVDSYLSWHSLALICQGILNETEKQKQCNYLRRHENMK